MTGEQLKLLSKMKRLIYQGKRKFLDRKDRNYLDELLKIGISEDDAKEKTEGNADEQSEKTTCPCLHSCNLI